jgi:hypothetical protein
VIRTEGEGFEDQQVESALEVFRFRHVGSSRVTRGT